MAAIAANRFLKLEGQGRVESAEYRFSFAESNGVDEEMELIDQMRLDETNAMPP